MKQASQSTIGDQTASTQQPRNAAYVTVPVDISRDASLSAGERDATMM